MAILLARVDGRIFAIGDTCTHLGCSLAEGKLHEQGVECPCHGSRFSLRDGAVLQGPASQPELTFEVRERAGQIEVRLSPDSAR
jgi:nitrite reductase/ring-hydroxylating ferredoxin subunit